MPTTVTLEPARQGEVEALLTLSAEFAAALYPPESNFMLSVDELEEPGVRFFVARTSAGAAVGIAALVPLPGPGSTTATAELKRMFVHPEARGEGIAALLLGAVEDEARAGGIRRLLLETGPLHVAALAFYRRHGYEQVAQFGQYVGEEFSVCFAKDL